MGTIRSPNCPKHVPFAISAMLSTYSRSEIELIELDATKLETLHKREFYLSSAVLATPKNHIGRFNKAIVSIPVQLKSPTTSINIAFTAKPAYKLCITYKIPVCTMHTDDCLLDNAVAVNLIRLLKISPSWSNGIKCQNVRRL